jgi:hypothetical protein
MSRQASYIPIGTFYAWSGSQGSPGQRLAIAQSAQKLCVLQLQMSKAPEGLPLAILILRSYVRKMI